MGKRYVIGDAGLDKPKDCGITHQIQVDDDQHVAWVVEFSSGDGAFDHRPADKLVEYANKYLAIREVLKNIREEESQVDMAAILKNLIDEQDKKIQALTDENNALKNAQGNKQA